jgi:membrane-bound inhibitor of C-type lysozyme
VTAFFGTSAIGVAMMFAAACSAQSAAEAKRPSLYRCADGRTFTVDQQQGAAEVTYYDEHFRLPRRSSGVGARYATQDATLIIDGDMAAFVTENIVDLEACRALRV